MKTTKLVLLALSTLLVLSIAAVPMLNLARVTLINKSGFDLQVRIEEVGEPQNVQYIDLPSGDRDDPAEVILDLYALGDDWKWYVTGWAKTDTAYQTLADGTVKYVYSFPCYGEADKALWDEKTATRVFVLKGVGENKNKINFTPESCEVPPVKWYTLPSENYFYTRMTNSWVY